jgi:hypothetical protein
VVEFGADQAGTFEFTATAAADAAALGLSSKGQALSYDVKSDDLGGGVFEYTLRAFVDLNGIPGGFDDSDRLVATFTLNSATGAFAFKLFDQFDHVDADGENTVLKSSTIPGGVPVIPLGDIIQVKDADNDGFVLEGQLNLTVTDDVPAVIESDCLEPGAGPFGDLLYVIPTGTSGLRIDVSNVTGDAGFHNSLGYYFADEFGNPISGAILLDNAGKFDDDNAFVFIGAAEIPADAELLGFFIIPNGDIQNPTLTDGDLITFDFNGSQWIVLKDGNPLASAQGAILFSDRQLNPGQADMEQPGGGAESNWEDKFIDSDNDYNDVMFNIQVCAVPFVSVLVHEDALNQGLPEVPPDGATGNLDNDGDGDVDGADVAPDADEATITAAMLNSLVVSGADEPLIFALNGAITGQPVTDTSGVPITSNGVSVFYHSASSTELVGFADEDLNGSFDDGTDRVVFTFTSNPDGSFTFDLDDLIDHDPAAGDTGILTLAVGAAITASDSDGDQVVLNPQAVQVNVENDVAGDEDPAVLTEQLGLTTLALVLDVPGNDGNDTVIGSSGDDVLAGTDGDDVMVGGAGNDTLEGGPGLDRFLYEETGPANRDTIHGYEGIGADRDIIDLSALLDANFGPASDVTDFVRVTDSGADALVQVDPTGSGNFTSAGDVAILAGYGTVGNFVSLAFEGAERQVQVQAP